ncbi:MAG: ATP-dependent metallopeptidase FtsH/Yme1/Tma family protein [Nitrospirae bacterium]|nr:MAG: ATP-dependent metallopeptidase FtsH/Yme1/Tma family protein [Nitrospirota bacterium]
MNSRVKNLIFWVVVGLFMILLFNLFTFQGQSPDEEVKFSEFVSKVEQSDVREVTIRGNYINGLFKDGRPFKTYMVEYPDLVKVLREHHVTINAKPPEDNPWYVTLLVTWGPFILFLALWFFLMRQMQIGGNKALSFGRSRARLLTEDRKKITFSDVAGIDEAKEEVVEIIEFLKDPHKFQKLGGRIPKGVLIVGPPGTGKTLLAKAIAGEAGVPFFSISGSDFVEMFVGVGASRVRDLFEQGKKHAPCIIFIDEIDAVGRLRGAGLGGGHDEREQTLNQLLVEMDGFDTTEGVILIAATNRPDVLDPALLRPGRFDRQITVNRPDVRGRTEILKVHTKKVPLAKDVDLEVISRGTPGFSGADLENLVNEAALLAARLNKTAVELKDFEFAKDKVLMGVERKSMVLTEQEKRTTAYHEAGHALMAKLLPGTDPVHKVTIIPRGRALGLTMQLPVDDRHSYSKEFLYNNLAILMGGRVAEELVFKQITTGAGNDIERATDLARKMVCEWGMSDELGPLTFGKKDEEIFLGREIATRRDYSEEIALKIDSEVKRLVTENYERAKRMLRDNMAALKALAEALLEKEVLEAAEIDQIIHGALSQEPQGVSA